MATDALEALTLNWLLRSGSYTTYLGLWQASPTVTGLQTGEMIASGYARQQVTWGTDWKNTNLIQWIPTGFWGNISFVVVCDSLTGGQVWDYAAYAATLDGSTGLQIPIGALTFVIP